MNFFPHFLSGFLLLALKVFLAFAALGILFAIVVYAGNILYYLFYPLYFVTLKPFVWAFGRIRESRCPKCHGFFRRKFVKSEITQEREAVRPVPRTETGVIHSNRLFAPNQDIEFTREVDVPFVQRWGKDYWACKDPLCGHEWSTEEFFEHEKSLEE